MDPLGGHGPLTGVLFAENVYKNERIGSHRWGVRLARPPRSANVTGNIVSYANNHRQKGDW